MSELVLEHVSKTYKDSRRRQVKAVSDVSFSIDKGEVLGLVGESGCGKSTIANMIVSLLKADEGKILFHDQDLETMNARKLHAVRRDIQMVFQDPYSSLNPRRTIGWLMEEPLKLYEKQLSDKERNGRVHEMLEDIGLSDAYADRYPGQLSGGQRQRVSIGLALMLKPSLLICDEPVSALDVSIQAQILNLLNDLQEKYQLTSLFISHDLQVVAWMADRIAVMYLGHIVEMGTTDEILAHPLHPYTKALFSAASMHNGEQIILKGEIPSPSNPPSGCPFRTRCPVADEKCAQAMPRTRTYGEKHTAACWKAGVEL